jgi:hypothetical protein
MRLLNVLTRRRSDAWALLLVVTVLGGAFVQNMVGAETAETRRRSSVYLAGDGTTVDCSNLRGGACFTVGRDEIKANIGVVDDLGKQPVSARYEFRDPSGAVIEYGEFCDSTIANVPAGSVRLAVMVAAANPISCGAPAVGSTGKILVVSTISKGQFEAFDVTPQVCLQPTPEAISLGNGATEPEDNGQPVILDVLVLLDLGENLTRERGEAIMEKSKVAYAPLGIEMRFDYRKVKFPRSSGNIMLSNTAAAVGGEVPPGYDVVHTLTDSNGLTNVGGQADCIGGVRYRDRAFSVSRALLDRKLIYVGGPNPIEGRMINDYAAKIVAHEIGHTMGGHHHYGNCVEAEPEKYEGQSCTVMLDPSPFPKELIFGEVNGAIIRAHAVRYAREGFGSVEGFVTDSRTGVPVKGANVKVSGGPSSGASATTDSEGRYVIKDIVAGQGYSLTASSNGYLTQTRQDVVIQEGPPTSVDFSLEPKRRS